MSQDGIPLREVRVRTVRPDEEPRWNDLMRERHYLGFRNFCGNRLRQVAVLGERWLALLGWHAAALHCAARDRWIGWTSLQRRQRLFLVANQSRFLLLTAAGRSPHLASRVLGLSLRQLPREWQRRHGAPLLLADSCSWPRASRKRNSVQTRSAMAVRWGKVSLAIRAETRASPAVLDMVSRMRCCWCTLHWKQFRIRLSGGLTGKWQTTAPVPQPKADS